MFAWLRKFLYKTPEPINPYIGTFVNWKIDHWTATSPCNNYCLWIRSGFDCFRDRFRSEAKTKGILAGLDEKERRLIWDALMHDMAVNARRNLKEFKRDIVKNVEF